MVKLRRARASLHVPGIALWKYDVDLQAEFPILCGVDEVGRGPLAGMVVAACVILDLEHPPIVTLDDSKRMSPEAREQAFPEIKAKARAYGIGEATPEEIDRLNILRATFLAMQRALTSMGIPPGLILVDGNQTIPDIKAPQRCLVKGDRLSASIAAASVLAKVTRDRQMEELHGLFPEYGFDSHKGYATETHRKAIDLHGLTPFHRRSFCVREALQESLFPVPPA